MMTAETSLHELLTDNPSLFSTPAYVIDENLLLKNMKKIAQVRMNSGAKAVLALKCFSTWSVFPLMREYMDGTTSSSLYEARLGAEKFGKETHAYSVAFSDSDVEQARAFATKFIFNSVSQLKRFHARVHPISVGLRLNPGLSHSAYDLADPARKCSRLGTVDLTEAMSVASLLSGVMFHCQCENDDIDKFEAILGHIARSYGPLLEKLEWVSLGGGIYFTKEGYPLDRFSRALADFSKRFNVQVYLEPGEAAITQAGFFVTRVLDVVHNDADIAIVDAAVEPHMLDLLIYRAEAKLAEPDTGPYRYTIAGRTCLAGDVFGTYNFPAPLKVGDVVVFGDAAGYTMVKKNWFNGVAMPSIVVRRLDGRFETIKQFGYDDYVGSLS
jgi:carboxynorspermidine decarboxylase